MPDHANPRAVARIPMQDPFWGKRQGSKNGPYSAVPIARLHRVGLIRQGYSNGIQIWPQGYSRLLLRRSDVSALDFWPISPYIGTAPE
jgi:hypothetical protein